MRIGHLFVAFAIAVSASGPDAALAAKGSCKLIRIDEWSVLPDIPQPILEGSINGRRIGVMIDTGMLAEEGALLELALARQLGVFVMLDPNRTAGGIGGEALVGVGIIGEIKIGQAKRQGWLVLVAGQRQAKTGVFLLGNRFFRDNEVEFDLSHQRVRLFKSQDCEGESLGYWSRSSIETPIKGDKGIVVKVLLNGKPVMALLDSGAGKTVIDTSVLSRIGAESQLQTAPRGGCLRGLGKQAVRSQIGQFETITIGDELIRNPKMYFADLRKDVPRDRFLFWEIPVFDMPEMILGADFLHAHRVLVSQPQGKLFFTYEGGTVFPTEPARGCPEVAIPKQQSPGDGQVDQPNSREEGR